MFRFKTLLFAFVVAGSQLAIYSPSAEAGLLRDWFNRCRLRHASTCAPAPTCAPSTCNNYAGLQPGQCMTTCQQTCSRVVVNYVPCTSYRTVYDRVPVTQYRPQTSQDPCTGCTVTCMRPCTTYTYQTRRVPYTTYRPVYQTQTYKVPVTTITNDCNSCASPCASGLCSTGTCDTGTCATGTCGTGLTSATGMQFQTVPNGTISTDGSYGYPSGTTVTPLPTPADTTPGIDPQNSNRSVIEGSSTQFQVPVQSQNNWTLTSTKAAVNREWSDVPVKPVQSYTVTGLAPASPVTRHWDYSPVRQASYTSVSTDDKPSTIVTTRGHFEPVQAKPVAPVQQERQVNEGWETVQW